MHVRCRGQNKERVIKIVFPIYQYVAKPPLWQHQNSLPYLCNVIGHLERRVPFSFLREEKLSAGLSESQSDFLPRIWRQPHDDGVSAATCTISGGGGFDGRFSWLLWYIRIGGKPSEKNRGSGNHGWGRSEKVSRCEVMDTNGDDTEFH